jgi:hypothetical protein
MKLIIAGSRDFPRPKGIDSDTFIAMAISAAISNHLPHASATESSQLMTDLEIVSGGAPGPDTWAAKWAERAGKRCTVFPADWDSYGKAAGPRRNGTMSAYGDFLIALWDGSSKGTHDMIRQMAAYKKPFIVFGPGTLTS